MNAPGHTGSQTPPTSPTRKSPKVQHQECPSCTPPRPVLVAGEPVLCSLEEERGEEAASGWCHVPLSAWWPLGPQSVAWRLGSRMLSRSGDSM